MSAEISPVPDLETAMSSLSPDVIRVAQALVAAVSPPKPEPAPMSRPGDELPPLLTIGQTATLMQVSEMTVRRAIWANELPSVRFRGTYRIPLAFVQRVLKAANAGTAVVVEEFAAAWQAEVAGSGVA